MDVIATDVAELDITDTAAVLEFVSKTAPDACLNAAAWTAVDDAEDNEAAAYSVNRDGAANLANACDEHDIPLVHYSTDYVFDGRKSSPYVEQDTPNPINVYGRSKLDSEESVRAQCERHLVLRTSGVFSQHGSNFVKTMLRLGQQREVLQVVSDQIFKPTAAAELARLTLQVLSRGEIKWGTYHLAQPEAVSWHGFATTILDSASRQGIDIRAQDVEPIAASDYRSATLRPANSALDCSSFEETFELRIGGWNDTLDFVIAELASSGFFAQERPGSS